MVVDEGCQDLRADADLLKGDYGMLLSVGAGRNTPQAIKTSGSSKEIVLSTFKRHLPVRSARWCTLLQMRQNGLDQKAELGFPVNPHMLRHACGYILANRGMDTRSLQAYLGHKSIQHTVRYAAMSPTRFKGIWKKEAP